MPDIKYDEKNFRIHTDKNKRVIKKSLEDCGAGRSVLVDKDNVLIAGNGVYEQAQELGLPVRVIETDGKELVVVKRNDLSSDDEKRKLLALADNHASDTSMFDMDLVLEEFSPGELDLWEFEIEGFDIDDNIDTNDINRYSKKIKSPIYEPIESEPPKLEELFKVDKYDQLLNKIKEANIPEREKEFLRYAATRHLVFNYSAIAEYYAHAQKIMQELMEDSALVIIDFDKAIEAGYVRLSEEIADQYRKEHGE